LGAEPWRREAAFLRQMTLVMGQKNQLIWDIPAMDTFLMNQAIYNLPQAEFRRTLDAFIAQLEIGGLLDKPVRNLSLGERMKCELVAALLHCPQVLFLDEPTLGLDVTMQSRIRAFIHEYNRRTGATVLLTSHYMADIEALCERVIVIHHGRLLFDGRLRDLIERTAPYKVLRVAFETPYVAQLAEEWGEVVERTPAAVALRVPKSRVREVTGRLLAEWPVADVSVEDPPVEHVIEQVFAGGASAG
ncbi:MAG TPA: AAA family ATPase, partial [Limnochordia bacterium]|nr:AAA family ATPase [Limnochordia bacterium]